MCKSDALLIAAPIGHLPQDVAAVQDVMGQASEAVLGFRLRSDAKLILYPERYGDPRGTAMWDRIKGLLDTVM
jgi:hypothetical protein